MDISERREAVMQAMQSNRQLRKDAQFLEAMISRGNYEMARQTALYLSDVLAQKIGE